MGQALAFTFTQLGALQADRRTVGATPHQQGETRCSATIEVQPDAQV
jgi:hypothetical protein